jgi:hypothetical protein
VWERIQADHTARPRGISPQAHGGPPAHPRRPVAGPAVADCPAATSNNTTSDRPASAQISPPTPLVATDGPRSRSDKGGLKRRNCLDAAKSDGKLAYKPASNACGIQVAGDTISPWLITLPPIARR